MARRAAVLAAVVVLAIAVTVQAGAGPQPILPADRAQAPSRLLDRTMRCTVPVHAGLREVHVAATSGSRDPANRSQWTHLANFSVVAGGSLFGGVGLAWTGVGAPEPKEVIWPGTSQGLSVSAACRLSDTRVALTPRGLPQGGVASPIRDAYQCVAPRTVLVRVRATFRVPTRLRMRADRLQTQAPVREAAVAVRAASGKPLAYASASESGRARLFVAARCLPD